MTRIIDYVGEPTEISDYLPEHYPENQTCESVDGIFINPHLRDDFDYTPNEEREDLEIEHWYAKPYICTDEGRFSTYEEYVARMSDIDPSGHLQSEEEYNKEIEQMRAHWLKAWPTGTRYEVRCLTYGAWDRSSSIGMFKSLQEAVEAAKGDIVCYRNLF